MSGKFSKKTKRAQARAAAKNSKKKSNTALWIGLGILTALLILSVLFLLSLTRGEGAPIPEETTPDDTEPTEETLVQIGDLEETSLYLDHGMVITDIGNYTGVYMEDGTDEIVSGVLMIVVTNNGEDAIEYAEITMSVDGEATANFSLSTLPAGESVVLLEKSRMAYRSDAAYDQAVADNVALFLEPLSLRSDVLSIQTVGGAVNVTNISDSDITGDIIIYYKNSSSDMLYGGITYRARIEGGLKAGELRQIMPTHFSTEGSTIMFVTVS